MLKEKKALNANLEEQIDYARTYFNDDKYNEIAEKVAAGDPKLLQYFLHRKDEILKDVNSALPQSFENELNYFLEDCITRREIDEG